MIITFKSKLSDYDVQVTANVEKNTTEIISIVYISDNPDINGHSVHLFPFKLQNETDYHRIIKEATYASLSATYDHTKYDEKGGESWGK
jgi:hypothetical protein